MGDKIYVDLFLALQRFKNICNLEEYTKKENYNTFKEMIHELNDAIYLLEIIDKEDEIL